MGVPLGLALGLSRGVASFACPILNFFQSVSGIAWLPLMLVWFGFGERTILVAVNYTVLFPVAFNALLGVRSVPPLYRDALRTLEASRRRIVKDVILPGALPHIAMGMRPGTSTGRTRSWWGSSRSASCGSPPTAGCSSRSSAGTVERWGLVTP